MKNTVPAIIRKSRRIVLPAHHRTRKPGIRPTQVGLTEPQVALKLGSSWVQVGGRKRTPDRSNTGWSGPQVGADRKGLFRPLNNQAIVPE
ncbi:hypothetical protein [Photorhabdus sp. RM71S]|uniref:hypothetical protein n=1 Tax=Photorhabdus sp. RM71S TaxID=3342824 RepID=UPI0036DE908B